VGEKNKGKRGEGKLLKRQNSHCKGKWVGEGNEKSAQPKEKKKNTRASVDRNIPHEKKTNTNIKDSSYSERRVSKKQGRGLLKVTLIKNNNGGKKKSIRGKRNRRPQGGDDLEGSGKDVQQEERDRRAIRIERRRSRGETVWREKGSYEIKRSDGLSQHLMRNRGLRLRK